LAGSVYVFQRHFLFFPTAVYETPQQANVDARFHELRAHTDDGLDLVSWYAPASDSKRVIVFFHGNKDYLKTAARVAAPYLAAGYGFALLEYRGYSGMPGEPTEKGLYADARAQISRLEQQGVKAQDMVFYGHSLGTGVAVEMADQFHPAGLILLAPYVSITRMGQLRFPYLPVRYLAKDTFDSLQKIRTLQVPLLIANGGHDNVIPPSQGEQLFTAAPSPKKYFFDPNGGHSDMFGPPFATESLTWLAALAPRQEPKRPDVLPEN
jgi:fermentation-respiration switch protein FrsA (DUF1100 family)